jgi:hypothetical protein
MLGRLNQTQAICLDDEGGRERSAFRARVEISSRFVLSGRIGKWLKSAMAIPMIIGVTVTLGFQIDYRSNFAGCTIGKVSLVACASTVAGGANVVTDTSSPRASGSGSICNPTNP